MAVPGVTVVMVLATSGGDLDDLKLYLVFLAVAAEVSESLLVRLRLVLPPDEGKDA